MARPSIYTPELADLICEQIADGNSLRSVCADEAMPSKTTVFRWLAANPAFRDHYARAREAQADSLADDILDIADDSAHDTYIDENGNERTNTEVVARSRLRVDARKWIAAKLKPKVYGDKVSAELSGPNGGDIPVSVAVRFVQANAGN